MRFRARCSRLDSLAWIALVIVVVVGVRLFYLQVLRYPHYRSLQARQVLSKQEVPARRGRIFDRQGRLLAFDSVGYDVSVLPRRLRPQDVGVLADHLNVEPAKLKATLDRSGRFVTLRRGASLSPEGARRLGTLPGVCIEKRSYRQYPFGTLAAQTIGFTDQSGDGREGIEKAFDAVLRGEPGEVVLLEDEHGGPIGLRSRREPVDGEDLTLTLDVDLQMIADAELQRSVREYGARGGAVLIIEPHTAELLACASAPAPLDRGGDYDPDAWRNRAIADLFEPGSTLKPLTAAVALRRGVVTPTTRIFAERGAMRFGAAGVIHDAHEPGDGWLTFTEAFAKSSNICFAKIARALSSDAMYDELRAFGFGSLTGIELPGETDGSLQLPRRWSGRTRLSLGYGHEIGVTAIQLAGLYTTIASGGVLRTPTVVAQVGGDVPDRGHQPVRRVLEQDLACAIQALCRGVVDSGTGDQARIEGVATAGKTGTAQKSVGGRYVQRFVASFGGFVPAEEPRLVCLVVLDEPRGVYHWGGQSAAPTFQRIVEGILRDGRWLEPQADRVRLVHAGDLGQEAPLETLVRRSVTQAGDPVQGPPKRLARPRRAPPKRAGLLP